MTTKKDERATLAADLRKQAKALNDLRDEAADPIRVHYHNAAEGLNHLARQLELLVAQEQGVPAPPEPEGE